jgi:hypothetical protein
MTKYRSLLAKSMNASREHSTPLYVGFAYAIGACWCQAPAIRGWIH